MASQQFSQVLTMIGANGFAKDSGGNQVLARPDFYGGLIKYINIQNLTSNVISIFSGHADPTTNAPTFRVGAYMSLTLPLTQDIAQGLQIYFVNSTGDTAVAKQLTLVWTQESLLWNASLAPSYTGGVATPNNVNIINQPTVNIGNTPTVSVTGTVPVSGDFDGASSQGLSVAGAANTAISMTVPAVAGKVPQISHLGFVTLGAAIGASDVPIVVTDNGGGVLYRACFGSGQARGQRIFCDFAKAIHGTVGQSITITVAAGGAGVIIYGNVGYYYK